MIRSQKKIILSFLLCAVLALAALTAGAETTVKVFWEDSNNASGMRPSATHPFMPGVGQIELNEANGWTGTFAGNGPISAEGHFPYGILTGHDANGTLILTYTLSGFRLDVPVVAAVDWADGGAETMRPEKVSVHLLRNGESYDVEDVTADSLAFYNWKYRWYDLPTIKTTLLQDGSSIIEEAEYAVEPLAPLAHYATSVSKAADASAITYTITNTLTSNHDWHYTADGETVTATCSFDSCEYHDSGIALGLIPHASGVHSGHPFEAALDRSALPSTLPYGLAPIPAGFAYFRSAGAGSAEPQGEALSSAPTENGHYVVRMTWGGATASAAFSITDAPEFGEPFVVLPDSVRSIGARAFAGAAGITVVDARHCLSVGAEAFADCKGLTQVQLSKECAIDPTAFSGCTSLIAVYAEGGGKAQQCAAEYDIPFSPLPDAQP